MAIAGDLLELAKSLARQEVSLGRPRQANLRRAVSTAYYAVFHLLASDAALQASALTPRSLRDRVQRAITHEAMKQAANAFRSWKLPPHVDVHLALPVESEIAEVANRFVLLQEARHKADYDLTERFSKQQVQTLIKDAESLFVQWRRVRKRDNAHVFLAAVVFWKLWSK